MPIRQDKLRLRLGQHQSCRISIIRGGGQRFSKKISPIRASDSPYSVVFALWKPSDGAKNLLEVPSEILGGLDCA